jgi:hypothetical protein
LIGLHAGAGATIFDGSDALPPDAGDVCQFVLVPAASQAFFADDGAEDETDRFTLTVPERMEMFRGHGCYAIEGLMQSSVNNFLASG